VLVAPRWLLPLLSLLFLNAAAAGAQYRVDSWGTDRGLPQNSVTAVLQTRDGYLWLGTFGGLVRFDGVKFTVFEGGGSTGLRSSRVLTLFEDRAGALWIGTERGGVTRYANGIFTTYTERDGLPFDNVASIHEDGAGRVWFATTRGLAKLEAGAITAYTTSSGLPSNEIWRVAGDRDGNVWIATREGLVRHVDGRFVTEYSVHNGLPRAFIAGIGAGRDGSLWLATSSAGLVRILAGKVSTYTTEDGLPSNKLSAIMEDRAGRLWIGSDRGLSRMSPASGEQLLVTREHGLSDRGVLSLAEDREGNVWAGTNTGGLNRLKTGIVTAFGRADGLPGDAVVPIVEDLHGALWIGMTCGGLVRYQHGGFRTYGVADGLPNDCVWSLLAGRDGSVWLGTWGYGLSHFKDGRFTTYSASNSALSNGTVLALHEDSAGALWIGTANGLNRLANGVFTVYRRRDGLVHDDVRFVTAGRDGALWIGTSGGASRFKDGRFTNYTTANGLSHDFVRAIHETDDGVVWFGTYGGGLDRLEAGRMTHITTEHGLSENIVSRILEDDRGHFWMTGNKGISRVSRRALDDVAAGRARSIVTIVYGVADGMISSECNGGGQPAGWKDRGGILWFPTARGVVKIDPRQVIANSAAPPVLIERVLVDGAPRAPTGELDIPARTSTVEIQYTGLSFSAPDQVRFRYKLEGLDEAWSDAGTRRWVNFSHLPPGRYSFVVTAANAGGAWNAAGAAIRLRIVPPFYRTWWFVTLVSAAGAALVFAGYERRIRRLTRAKQAHEAFSRRLIESQEGERKRIAAELHDSLSQTLAVIKNRALLSLQTPDDHRRALEQLDEIVEAAAHALDEVRDISYNLRPYHLDRLGLAKAIEAMLDKVLVPRGIRVRTDIDALEGVLSSEVEIGIYRIAQEAVNNIVKHAAATDVSVTIRRQDGSVAMTIRDNGAGFTADAARRAGGFGLIGIAERARLLGTEPVIDSAPGRGTTLRIAIAVGNADGP